MWIWKAVTTKHSDVLHLTVFLSHSKTPSFWPSVIVPDYVVSPGNRYSTFRDNLVVSRPMFEILSNISPQKDVRANLFRNVNNQLTSNKTSQLKGKEIECNWSHPGWIWERLEAGMVNYVLKHKILKGCLEGIISTCADNIKMCLKETGFDFILNYSTISEG